MIHNGTVPKCPIFQKMIHNGTVPKCTFLYLCGAMMRARRFRSLAGFLLLATFLQALLLASVHHHPFSGYNIHAESHSQNVIDVQTESQHCYVCEFLATVNLYASEQASALEISFVNTELTPSEQDVCLRQAEAISTRAPPAVFI